MLIWNIIFYVNLKCESSFYSIISLCANLKQKKNLPVFVVSWASTSHWSYRIQGSRWSKAKTFDKLYTRQSSWTHLLFNACSTLWGNCCSLLVIQCVYSYLYIWIIYFCSIISWWITLGWWFVQLFHIGVFFFFWHFCKHWLWYLYLGSSGKAFCYESPWWWLSIMFVSFVPKRQECWSLAIYEVDVLLPLLS